MWLAIPAEVGKIFRVDALLEAGHGPDLPHPVGPAQEAAGAQQAAGAATETMETLALQAMLPLAAGQEGGQAVEERTVDRPGTRIEERREALRMKKGGS